MVWGWPTAHVPARLQAPYKYSKLRPLTRFYHAGKTPLCQPHMARSNSLYTQASHPYRCPNEPMPHSSTQPCTCTPPAPPAAQRTFSPRL